MHAPCASRCACRCHPLCVCLRLQASCTGSSHASGVQAATERLSELTLTGDLSEAPSRAQEIIALLSPVARSPPAFDSGHSAMSVRAVTQ